MSTAIRNSFSRLASTLILALCLLCQQPTCYASVTSYSTMLERLRVDSALKPQCIHLFQIGESATKEHGIWLVRLASADSPKMLGQRPRVLFICRQHGDEPVSTEATLKYIDLAAREKPKLMNSQIGDTVVYIIPMANPDGAEKLTRLTGVNADLNRDWGKFTQPETRAIYSAYKQIKPMAVIDMHSWTPGDSFLSDSVEVPAGDSSSSSITSMDIDLQTKLINQATNQTGEGVTAFTYLPSSDLTLCHRFFASQQHVVAMLVETSLTSDSPGGMTKQILMDLSAINVVTHSLQAEKPKWTKIAKLEAMSAPSPTVFTQEYGGVSVAEREFQKEIQNERHSIKDSLIAYLAGVIVLIHFLGRPVWYAILRLLSRIDVATVDQEPVYVPYRRRHLSPNTANLE